MIQNLLVYLLIGLSVAFLLYRFLPKKNKKEKCDKCD